MSASELPADVMALISFASVSLGDNVTDSADGVSTSNSFSSFIFYQPRLRRPSIGITTHTFCLAILVPGFSPLQHVSNFVSSRSIRTITVVVKPSFQSISRQHGSTIAQNKKTSYQQTIVAHLFGQNACAKRSLLLFTNRVPTNSSNFHFVALVI